MTTSTKTSGAVNVVSPHPVTGHPPVLVTGAAGFIGFHVARRLLTEGTRVIGVDNLNAYYDVSLKEARLAILNRMPGFAFGRFDLAESGRLEELMREHGVKQVIHLAAQAGVRYSLQEPHTYARSNLVGFLNVLEACRRNSVGHLVYASSSSIYGANKRIPFMETDVTDQPVSLYGATKKANELMAYSYSHLYGFPSTGLRFFTVYGPWGRPDMALFKFSKAILARRPIDLYNHGKMQRDFTYIDDIVEGVLRILRRRSWREPLAPQEEDGPQALHRVYNIGNHSPVGLDQFIALLENALGQKAVLNLLPMQDGEVPVTYADVSRLQKEIGFAPTWSLEHGIREFVTWYREYHRV
jgi:UDP-glucuronate 4-epimerase